MSSPDERLSVKEKVAYGLGDAASNFYFQFFNQFLTFYYTDIMGLAAKSVGDMIFALRAFDAVLDPTIGVIADRTTSRWGKFRPYILFSAVPYGILGYVMFLNPNFTPGGKLAYAYITYGLMWIAYTAINIPYSSLMGVMSSSSSERTSLSTFRFVGAFTASLVIGAYTLKLRDFLGHGDPARGIRLEMLGFATISVAMFLITFLYTKERVKPEKSRGGNLKQDFVELLKNPPWIILFFAALLILVNVAVRGGAIVYYFKYVVRNEDALFDFNLWGTIAFIVGIAVTKVITKWADKKTLIVLSYGINALLMLAMYFVDPANIRAILWLNIAANFVAGPSPALLWAMYADVADYSEWRFKRRSTGLVFSGSVFSQKLGLAVGSGGLARMLDYYGFVANAEQTGAALVGIRMLFSVIPAVLALAGVVIIFFYPLTDAKVKEIESDLRARKAALEPTPS